jgi:hypothetical protein
LKDQLTIICSRSQADEVEDKLRDLDADVEISLGDSPKLTGIIEALSIVASLSTVAASSFVIWAEVERRRGKDIRVEPKPTVQTGDDDTGSAKPPA